MAAQPYFEWAARLFDLAKIFARPEAYRQMTSR